MAAREIRIDRLGDVLHRFGLFAMSIGMSCFLHYFGMQYPPAIQAPNFAFAAFFMWILGIWLIIFSYVIAVLPGERKIAAQVVEFIENYVLNFNDDILF